MKKCTGKIETEDFYTNKYLWIIIKDKNIENENFYKNNITGWHEYIP